MRYFVHIKAVFTGDGENTPPAEPAAIKIVFSDTGLASVLVEYELA